jgi:hypothetical protein
MEVISISCGNLFIRSAIRAPKITMSVISHDNDKGRAENYEEEDVAITDPAKVPKRRAGADPGEQKGCPKRTWGVWGD